MAVAFDGRQHISTHVLPYASSQFVRKGQVNLSDKCKMSFEIMPQCFAASLDELELVAPDLGSFNNPNGESVVRIKLNSKHYSNTIQNS